MENMDLTTEVKTNVDGLIEVIHKNYEDLRENMDVIYWALSRIAQSEHVTLEIARTFATGLLQDAENARESASSAKYGIEKIQTELAKLDTNSNDSLKNDDEIMCEIISVLEKIEGNLSVFKPMPYGDGGKGSILAIKYEVTRLSKIVFGLFARLK